ncbi:hypothetical protein Acsp05_23010 [Actinokineospora sp. NBRC 105648]|nr:hypothetical protein Acsp05_23010 [Actinokineospora sp. NBRC 105648]
MLGVAAGEFQYGVERGGTDQVQVQFDLGQGADVLDHGVDLSAGVCGRGEPRASPGEVTALVVLPVEGQRHQPAEDHGHAPESGPAPRERQAGTSLSAVDSRIGP